MPKYYLNKFNFGYNIYVRHNVKNISTYYKYTKLSCNVLLEVMCDLFISVFKNTLLVQYIIKVESLKKNTLNNLQVVI